MYDKVLVPVDGSALAECALNHAGEMAKGGFAREVTVLNVVKIDVPWVEVRNQKFDINKLRDLAFEEAGRYLEGVKAKMADQGVAAKTEVIEANRPADAINDFARGKGMDLIIMATHGHTGIKELMLGGVARSVLLHSTVPVLLIRPGSCFSKAS